MKYVIEHFGKAFKWHLIEYEHISKLVGKENLIFTNVKGKKEALSAFGETRKESIAELCEHASGDPNEVRNLGFPDVCILDPASDKILTPEDCKRFKYLVFGGILGDYPPRERTKELLTCRMKNVETRNLGKEQMPTDNAVYAAKLIAEGKRFEDIKFIDTIEIDVRKGLSVELPFRYISINGKPLVSEKLVEFLKKRRTI
ncbi:MAG: SAM-dependent methyltransferase [Nanoarchaeota archaeon]